ncbi:MAG: DUF1513 domain-containing protein [Planctomycetes bacterium]|nr:DUF1513 domain-containing protein [Planctomycetota bacterium]
MNSHNRDANPHRRRFLAASAVVTGGLVAAACGGSNASNAASATGSDNAPHNTPALPKDPPKKDPLPATQKMKQGTLLTGGSQKNVETGEVRWVFSQLNLDKAFDAFGDATKRDPASMAAWVRENARLLLDIGFLVHGVIPNPKKPERVIVFQKKGKGGAEVDLKENKIIARIDPSAGCEFYGHGGYTADASILYATEYDATTYEGRMVVRDANSYKVLSQFQTFGEWPHDCQFLDQGRTVAVTNGGGHLEGGSKPNVCYIDVASGKLIEKIEFENPRINAGHLFVTPSGDLAVLHAMREGLDTKEAPGALSLRKKGGSLQTMVDPADITTAMKGETLSHSWYAKDNVIGVTNPFGDLVTFWSLTDQKYVSKRKIKQPRGLALTLDQKYFVLTFDKDNPNLIMIPADTREVEKPSIQFPLACDGSHAYVYDFPV